MAKERAGWERIMYVGTAGTKPTPPAGLVDQATDIDVTETPVRSPTTSRGDGSAIPKETQQVTQLAVSITFSMVHNDNDAQLATLLTAAGTGAPVAMLITLPSATAIEEFDGDVTLEVAKPGPLADTQVFSFTAIPTKEAGRTWTTNPTTTTP